MSKVRSDACSAQEEASVQTCLQPMLDYANQLQNDVGVQLTLQGNQVFERLCALYDQFVECTGHVRCRSVSIDAIQASYGYMCRDGREEFQQHVDCFGQVEAHTDYVQCKKQASGSISTLSVNRENVAGYLDQLCEIMTKYLRCSHKLIVDTCGAHAWQLVRRVTEDSLRVTMPLCNLAPVFA